MNARENPFRTSRVLEVRYRPLDDTWAGLMARLATLDYRASIVGPEGSGKTTLLEDLAPRLVELGFSVRHVFLNDQSRSPEPPFDRAFFADLGERDVILLDGADLMGRLAWMRFRRKARKAAGLVITSHRPGRLPTLTRCRTTPELLDEIIGEMLDEETRPVTSTARKLFDKHDGNLRDALRELYDTCAGFA